MIASSYALKLMRQLGAYDIYGKPPVNKYEPCDEKCTKFMY